MHYFTLFIFIAILLSADISATVCNEASFSQFTEQPLGCITARPYSEILMSSASTTEGVSFSHAEALLQNMKSGECFENWGRVIVASGYKLHQSICYCKTTPKIANQFSCASGAYRAWIQQMGLNSSFFSCSSTVQFPAACYRHVWEDFDTPMREAHLRCLGLSDKTHRHSCVHGVGYAYSAKYYLDTGLLFPIEKMCSVGNVADRVMCIHGYWGGINFTSTDEVMTKKSQSCQKLQSSTLVEACMLVGIDAIPYSSPLFHTSPPSFEPSSDSSQLAKILTHNISQAHALVSHGINQSHLLDFRKRLDSLNTAWSTDIFLEWYSKVGFDVMLHEVESYPECKRSSCHYPCHTLGKVVYMITKSFEVSVYVCGWSCGDGCFHGAMNQYFLDLYQSSSQHDSAMVPYYAALSTPTSMSFTTHKNGVYHAIGHSIMPSVANYSYSKGLSHCKMLSSRSGQLHCAFGSYMELFRFSNFTPVKFSPCDLPDADFPAFCYLYVWPLSLSEYPSVQDGQNKCLSLHSKLERSACFFGMATAYSTSLWAHTRTTPIADICSTGSIDDKRMCVYGAASWHGPYSRNTTLLRNMCDTLTEDFLRRSCMLLGGSDKFRIDEDSVDLFYYTSEMRQAG